MSGARAAPEPPKVPVKSRGSTKLLLAAILLGSVVGGAAGLIDVALGHGQEDTLDPASPERLLHRLVVLALLGLVNAGCAVGTWSYRRWGVYGVVCASLVAFMVNMKIGALPVALPGLVAVGCLVVFVAALWIEFD
jgi:hypothetical protein